MNPEKSLAAARLDLEMTDALYAIARRDGDHAEIARLGNEVFLLRQQVRLKEESYGRTAMAQTVGVKFS